MDMLNLSNFMHFRVYFLLLLTNCTGLPMWNETDFFLAYCEGNIHSFNFEQIFFFVTNELQGHKSRLNVKFGDLHLFIDLS